MSSHNSPHSLRSSRTATLRPSVSVTNCTPFTLIFALPFNSESRSQSDDARATRLAQTAIEGVACVHDELRQLADAAVVELAVVGDNDDAVGRLQLFICECD